MKIPTIQELRNLNWKVRVTPFRNLNQNAKYKKQLALLPERHARTIGAELGILTRGGKVVIDITPPESRVVFQGVSVCHPTENFNKKLGNYMALKSALAKAGICEK